MLVQNDLYKIIYDLIKNDGAKCIKKLNDKLKHISLLKYKINLDDKCGENNDTLFSIIIQKHYFNVLALILLKSNCRFNVKSSINSEIINKLDEKNRKKFDEIITLYNRKKFYIIFAIVIIIFNIFLAMLTVLFNIKEKDIDISANLANMISFIAILMIAILLIASITSIIYFYLNNNRLSEIAGIVDQNDEKSVDTMNIGNNDDESLLESSVKMSDYNPDNKNNDIKVFMKDTDDTGSIISNDVQNHTTTADFHRINEIVSESESELTKLVK